MKPPMNRKIRGLAYGAVALEISCIFRIGSRTMGRSEVAAIGIASVIHQIAISIATAAVRQAAASMFSGPGKSKRIRKQVKPAQKPFNCLFIEEVKKANRRVKLLSTKPRDIEYSPREK
jgi:hypothetical protein